MESIKIRQQSRGQRRRLQRGDKAIGNLAEELVAEIYDLGGLSLDADFWDVRDGDSGAKYEVKSTQTEIGDKYPSGGRFRVWKNQTESLIRSDAQGSAWYVFVLLHEPLGKIILQKRAPSTVADLVDSRGGWNKSGHESMGPQHKIPWEEVIDVE